MLGSELRGSVALKLGEMFKNEFQNGVNKVYDNYDMSIYVRLFFGSTYQLFLVEIARQKTWW